LAGKAEGTSEEMKRPGKYRTTNWAAFYAALKSRDSLSV